MSPESFEPPQNTPEAETGGLSLPESIDRDTTIFAYGFLLDKAKLRELVAKNRKDFTIQEASSIEEATKLSAERPNDVVILRGVRLDDVRVSIVTDKELREWYAKQGKSVEKAISQGVWPEEVQEHSILYARPKKEGEKGRFLNGGLVIGLSDTDLTNEIDPFEIPPVYTRGPVPKVTIGGQSYVPKHVTFYSAGIPEQERDPKEVAAALRYARARKFHDGKVAVSEYSHEAKWPHGVRSGKTRTGKTPPELKG